MPFDFKGIADQAEQNLVGLTDAQGTDLESQLQQVASKARGMRQGFFNQNQPLAASTLGQFGLTQTGAGQGVANRNLEQALMGQLNQGRLNMRNQNLGQGLDVRNQIASRAQNQLAQQRGFSNQWQGLLEQQNFQAQQAEKDREYALQQDALKDYYTNQGLYIQDQYNNQNNQYQNALARAFGGVVGDVGNIYLQKQMYGNMLNNANEQAYQQNLLQDPMFAR